MSGSFVCSGRCRTWSPLVSVLFGFASKTQTSLNPRSRRADLAKARSGFAGARFKSGLPQQTKSPDTSVSGSFVCSGRCRTWSPLVSVLFGFASKTQTSLNPRSRRADLAKARSGFAGARFKSGLPQQTKSPDTSVSGSFVCSGRCRT